MAPRLPSLPPNLPGMTALGAYRPDVYAQMAALADNMLATGHPDSTLDPSEREMIATYVSSLNNCTYCMTTHGAVAVAHMSSTQSESAAQGTQTPKATAEKIVNSTCIKRDDGVDEIEERPKLRSLLQVAAQVHESGQSITPEAVAEAKAFGATDMDIHDTVLIAALFCMFNRYVDGLTGELSGNIEQLKEVGTVIAERGYAARSKAVKDEP